MSESDGNNNEDGVISQQEEEASLGSASIFSASDHTDGSDNDISDHEHGKKQTSTIEKWRFDPTGGKDEHSWHLLRGQDAFTTKYFSEYVGESAIKESILKSCPKPSTDALKPLVLDSDIVDLLPGSSQAPIKHADGSFKRIQVRLLDTMGPLGKLWSELEKAALHGNGKCDAKELLELAEKSVTLVGQTNVLINHNRRLNVLSRFMKDSKKATDILSQNQSILQRNRTSLFGNSFYKALYQKAKGRQHSQEIKRGLAAKPFRGLNRRQRRAEVHSGSKTWTHPTNTVQPAWPHKRPFQQGPSASNTSNSGGRGARRGTGPFKRGRGGFKNRYVYLTFNHPTNTRSKSSSISSRFEQSRRSCRSHRTLSKEDKSPDTIGRSTDFLSPQLGKTYKRSLDIGNCSWLPDRFSGSTQSEKGAIEFAKPVVNHFVGHVFLRRKKSGNYRPIFNLKPLNQFVPYEHFKMENMPMLMTMLQLEDWMATLDLKDAYSCILIHPEHRKFLRFWWDNTLFQYRTLPFGLASAPRVFTKLLRPVVAFLRQMGIRLLIYLDDVILLNQSQIGLEKDKLTVLKLLHGLGFVVNLQKSMLSPAQQVEYLGYLINSKNLTLSLPQRRLLTMLTIRETCLHVLTSSSIRVRMLSQLIGMLTSTVLAVLPAPLHYRFLQMQKTKGLLANHQNYNALVTMTADCREELQWWLHHLQEWNGKTMVIPTPDLVITTDSSLKGWGATSNGVTTQGLWSLQESREHINVLELKAAMFAVMAYAKDLSRVHILLRVDNRATMAQINKMGGARSHRLFTITKEFWEFCLSRGITIIAEHVPGVMNQIADKESRCFMDKSCWMLNKVIFHQIEMIWGNMEVDLFADRLTSQKKSYVSWKPDPGAIATDAFTLSWSSLNGYAFPPFCLISLCLAKVRRDKATLVLIAPVWPAQPWYPAILEMVVTTPILLPV